MLHDSNNMLIGLSRLDELPIEDIPAAITQLAAAQSMLAARLLVANGTRPPVEASGDRLLKTKEAAKRCGVSRDWLYRTSDGDLRQAGKQTAEHLAAQPTERKIVSFPKH